MLIVGLSGGIASGKSTFVEALREIDANLPILDCDKLAHECQKKGDLQSNQKNKTVLRIPLSAQSLRSSRI